MIHERLSSPDLLSKAAEAKKRKDQERASIEEARTRIPELQKKILYLFSSEIEEEEIDDPDNPEIITTPDGKKLLTPEFFRRMSLGLEKETQPRVEIFLVPVENEVVKVTIAQGLQTSKYSVVRDSGLEINIHELDWIVRLDDNRGTVESKEHKFKPFDMNTPIGSKSDLGPVWKRDMNMDDFNSYSELLDRLYEPDVVRVGK